MLVKTFIAAAVVFLLGAPEGEACSCPRLPYCESVWMHDAVFEGTVESIDDVPGRTVGRFVTRERRVRLRDMHAWMGRPAEVVYTGRGGGDCGYDFKVGVRYLIATSTRSWDGQPGTGICSPTRPLAEASEFLAYLKTITQSSPGARIFGQVLLDSSSRPPGSTTPVPLAGVQVTVRGPIERTLITNQQGRYSFDELPTGLYTVSAEVPAGRAGVSIFPSIVKLPNAHACASPFVTIR